MLKNDDKGEMRGKSQVFKGRIYIKNDKKSERERERERTQQQQLWLYNQQTRTF